MVLLAMSGRAYAGATISDTRYWPSEASSADQSAVQRPENAFASAEPREQSKLPGQSIKADRKGMSKRHWWWFPSVIETGKVAMRDNERPTRLTRRQVLASGVCHRRRDLLLR